MTDDLLTAAQAAQRLGLSLRQVQDLAKEGRLPAIRPGKEWLFRAAEIDALPARRSVGRPAGARDQRPRKRPARRVEETDATG